jgi:hypothetical protein
MLLKEDKTEKDPNNWAKVKEREAVKLWFLVIIEKQ